VVSWSGIFVDIDKTIGFLMEQQATFNAWFANLKTGME
jgi:hypothetical protein